MPNRKNKPQVLALTEMIPYNHPVHAGLAQLLERFLAMEEARS